MSENVTNVSVEVLRPFLTELFGKGNMPSEDAAYFADTILQANLWGVDSHGVIRVPVYLERLMCGAINAKPNMQIVKGDDAFVVVDADGAAGCVAGKFAMETAVEKAKAHGIAAVGVMNSNHFGAAALYNRIAVDAGMVGLAMTNVLPLIAAPGARAAVVGNNPLSVGIPTYMDTPFLLDMSLSVVAGGKLHLANKKGEKIPFGWAVDTEGRPTDDPSEALKGFLLPVGGYKGLGLAYVVDILCGVITGGVFADKMRSMYKHPKDPSLTGHLMVALDINKVITPEEMRERMTYYHAYLDSIPLAEGAPKLMFPGELEHNSMLRRQQSGIPVPLTTMDELNALKVKYGVKASL